MRRKPLFRPLFWKVSNQKSSSICKTEEPVSSLDLNTKWKHHLSSHGYHFCSAVLRCPWWNRHRGVSHVQPLLLRNPVGLLLTWVMLRACIPNLLPFVHPQGGGWTEQIQVTHPGRCLPLCLFLYPLFLSFWRHWGFWLMVLHLLGRCSTTWATPLSLFAVVIFQIDPHIHVQASLDTNPTIYSFWIAGMIGMYPYTQFFIG
jgi:hypothetical protein